MTLTREEVEHIALLARLDLSEDEIARYKQQLSAILDHIAQMQTLDTQNIQPTSSVLPPRTRLRSDEPRAGLSHEQALDNAPDIENRQFRVPPVLE
jgi:aspartyl-tRNA(Asn)/glutamyl-tRNA(Gln) amidotransferase subunit C